MLDITKQVWQMLMDEKSTEEILKICSLSSLCKIRAAFNRQKADGVLTDEPLRFPQKPRGKKSKKKGTKLSELPNSDLKNFNKKAFVEKNTSESPPSNYPRVGSPDVKIEENFEKGEKIYAIKSYEINTLDELIKWTDVDMEKFDCSSFTANRWGNEKWECTQCRATFVPKKRGSITPDEMAETFASLIKNYKPAVTNMPIDPVKTNIASIMPIADLHFGKLALANEIGHENNIKITRKNLLKSIDFHLKSMRGMNPDKIIIPILGDFYNTDTPNNTTTAGTFQEESSSWKNTSRKGVELMIEVIDMCRIHAMCPVKVVICNGNHDLMRSFALGLVLEAFYKDNKAVEIDNSHTVRKYEVFGNSIFGFGHGDTKANADYLGIMCEEVPDKFAMAKHRTMMIGHLHHKTVEERAGIMIRRVGSLTSSDSWHKTKGYQSVRSSESFLIDIKNGIISNSTFYLK